MGQCVPARNGVPVTFTRFYGPDPSGSEDFWHFIQELANGDRQLVGSACYEENWWNCPDVALKCSNAFTLDDECSSTYADQLCVMYPDGRTIDVAMPENPCLFSEDIVYVSEDTVLDQDTNLQQVQGDALLFSSETDAWILIHSSGNGTQETAVCSQTDLVQCSTDNAWIMDGQPIGINVHEQTCGSVFDNRQQTKEHNADALTVVTWILMAGLLAAFVLMIAFWCNKKTGRKGMVTCPENLDVDEQETETINDQTL